EEIEQRMNDTTQKTLLSSWYRRDDNQVSPVYYLKPREIAVEPEAEEVEKLKAKEKEVSDWCKIEQELRRILISAVRDMSWGKDQKVKYTASATEQEIFSGALRIADAPDHVFCYFRNINNLPLDTSAGDFIDLDEYGNGDVEAQEKLDVLKEKLRSRLPGNISEYEVDWTDGGITTGHLDRLCDDVYANLSGIILKEISRMEEIDALEKEIDDHAVFGADRARFFIGRITPPLFSLDNRDPENPR
ncbi:MAG: hypothetical protein MUP70_09285, partial [Candidatus Aminicenantes bacterium]|nr:hypothetical protein [Candidatus Aminicenantes bacterium]